MKPKDKIAYREWEAYYSQFIADVDIDTSESEVDKRIRIKKLESSPEDWFKYYFPSYCTAEPAKFHKKATTRLLENKRWYEVRAWSRELAKSARSMMEVLYLALTGEVKNVLLVSNNYENAERLLTPFMLQLERNLRIINDYGTQEQIGNWETGSFTAKCGCSFRALGAGQSPRGTRNEAKRPDFILIDDIDTDEECRNPDRIKTKWDWIEQALIPTVSISGDIRILFNGNIIAKDCCIVRASKFANFFDVINIRDKDGKSSWIEKNSESDIDFVLSKISTKSAQQEYFNNPISEGETFKEITYGNVPQLRTFNNLICYGDPAPSNSKNKANSFKSLWLIGRKDGVFYVIKGFLDHVPNADFIEWYFQLRAFVNERTQVFHYVENNTLQNPFYEQVFLPLFYQAGKRHNYVMPIIPDTRNKPDKFSRIEGNLEPINRMGKLIFNIKEKDNPHMERLAEQFLLVNPRLNAPADGPDCVEGGVWIAQNKHLMGNNQISWGKKSTNSKRY